MRSDVIDIDVHVHVKTERAVLISETGDRDAAEWVPLSQVEVEMTSGHTARVTMPEWLAIEKGFV